MIYTETHLFFRSHLQKQRCGAFHMFQVSDCLFRWDTKTSIRAEGLLKDDMELLDIHGERLMLRPSGSMTVRLVLRRRYALGNAAIDGVVEPPAKIRAKPMLRNSVVRVDLLCGGVIARLCWRSMGNAPKGIPFH